MYTDLSYLSLTVDACITSSPRVRVSTYGPSVLTSFVLEIIYSALYPSPTSLSFALLVHPLSLHRLSLYNDYRFKHLICTDNRIRTSKPGILVCWTRVVWIHCHFANPLSMRKSLCVTKLTRMRLSVGTWAMSIDLQWLQTAVLSTTTGRQIINPMFQSDGQ